VDLSDGIRDGILHAAGMQAQSLQIPAFQTAADRFCRPGDTPIKTRRASLGIQVQVCKT
jgi:hypothetical protein